MAAATDKTWIQNNGPGLRAETSAFASVTDSIVTGNLVNDLTSVNGGVINTAHSTASQNGGGVFSSRRTIRLTDMKMTDDVGRRVCFIMLITKSNPAHSQSPPAILQSGF